MALEHTRRRVRIYGVAAEANPEDRDVVARAARREFSLLEGIHHPGIVRAADYKEHELGPALVYEYDPEAERLDHYLETRRDHLTIDDRLHLVRELAETLRYAHDKGLVHRSLSPRSVIVSNPDSRWPQPKILDWHVGFQIEASQGHTVQATSHAEALVEEWAALLVARGVPALVYTKLATRTQTLAAALLQATTLSFLVVAGQIGVDLGLVRPVVNAALVTAGLLSAMLFPATALSLLRSAEDRPRSQRPNSRMRDAG